ncbi:hypothetical protein MJO28_015983 [Puccinia striiformis f. sp. tritici]|uniref:Uncharacterized protein n=2 Tax=Puccinia striiformis f. sp. tritici TaxID=168172 RepID=A0A0L0VD23_9BASI|nr:hypothetical protein Pst134EA_028989 [Puccinia striiformis f. sp. tritici]KAH9447005.1 hypothetical protein Pst134EA_028989 [Puccinia striiformis f. sp. tritici]KAI7937084.1 hypothetical protein MJO28_015983 [Puccinia striiformis f. sp. tritici]KNE97076.1 hypothetical protein PSTG_09650 [Puccinia striiformis f. sp. tritici PST-78]
MAPTALQLSSEERLAYPYLFSKADTDQIGVLVGEKAVAFFAHSNLPPTILGEIWQLADQDNAGFLTRQQFDIALRLIGKAQRGVPVNEQAISTPGPLCQLKGFSIPGLPSPSNPPAVRPPNSTPLGISEPVQDPLYTISNDDKVKYSSMFIKAGPRDGLLDGDKARDIFIRSKLSFEKLGQIWTLADTQSRGALSVGDFCIAMHLIQLSMSGRLSIFPTSLPSALLESSTTPAAGAALPISRQVTGQQQTMPGSRTSSSPLRQSTTGSMIRPQSTGRSGSGIASALPTGINSIMGSPTGSAWDISSAELAQSNIYFDSLDTNRLGYITGDRAVPFMMESKLPGEILARIWDLADIRGEGKLSREEFAVAMRLIQDTLAGGSESLTAKLAPGMVPPSLREPAGLPVIPETSTTHQDLLSLLDDPPNVTPSSQNFEDAKPNSIAPPTQQFALPVQLTGSHLMNAGARVSTPSSFAQSQTGIAAQATSQSVAAGQLSSSRGFGEDDGARLGNLVNQLSSNENGLSTLRDERSRLETETGSTAEQIKTLELKLSTVRQAHQTELPIVEELRRRQVDQRSTISKLTSDVITAESEFSSLKLEKEQIEGNILRDKEEIRDMKKRMSSLEEETQRLKSNLEILKKDSRLQKGLIAIGKKQVLTVEGQKADISKEVDDLTQQISSVTLPHEASRAPSPGVPPNLIPSQKSTNPFERMMPAASLAPQASAIDTAEASSSRDLTASTDPFLGASTDSAQTILPPSSNTLSFGDAFGLDDNRSWADNGGFHDALETTSPEPPLSATFATPMAKSPQDLAKEIEDPQKDDSDDSSDEEEIEDPIPRHLAPSSRSGKPASFASDKFPALEDVEASIESKAVVSPPIPSQDQEIQGENSPSSAAQVARSSEAVASTVGSTNNTTSIKSSADQKSVEQNKPAINFGDELEVSDFVADFGSVGGRASSATTGGATLEDFDSAFENLPSPGRKSTQEPTGSDGGRGITKPNDHNPTGATSTTSMGFDDGFDDAFVVMDAGDQASKKDQHDSFGFDESFSDFDKILASGKAPNNGLNENHGNGGDKKKKEQEDPFGSPPSSPTDQEPPPLPTRPSTSSISNLNHSTDNSSLSKSTIADKTETNVQVAKDSDSDAVKQICAMGFDRDQAILALERDDWDMDRALNHLLGT